MSATRPCVLIPVHFVSNQVMACAISDDDVGFHCCLLSTSFAASRRDGFR